MAMTGYKQKTVTWVSCNQLPIPNPYGSPDGGIEGTRLHRMREVLIYSLVPLVRCATWVFHRRVQGVDVMKDF